MARKPGATALLFLCGAAAFGIRSAAARTISFCGAQLSSDATEVSCHDPPPDAVKSWKLEPLTQLLRLRSLTLGEVASFESRPAVWARLRALRSLHLASFDVPVKHLRGLRGLRALSLQVDVSDAIGVDQWLRLPRSLETLHWLELANNAAPHESFVPREVNALSLVALRALRTLKLRGVVLQSGRALSALAALGTLELANFRNQDLAFLGHMDRLRSLSIHSELVSKLPEGISRLKGLRRLSLDDCPIPDLSVLGALKELRELSIRNTKVRKLGVLMALPKLERLRIDGAPVPENERKAYAARRPRVAILGAPPPKGTRLAELGGLKTLFGSKGFVDSLKDLAGASKTNDLMRSLAELGRAPTKGLGAMGYAGGPRGSLFSSTGGTSRRGIGGFSGGGGAVLAGGGGGFGISARNFRRRPPPAEVPFCGKQHLQDASELTCTGGVRPSWRDLARFTGVQGLDLTGAPIRSLPRGWKMPDLMGLKLARTRITSIAPLAGLPKLSTLDLRETAVTDVSPLMHLKELTKLDVRGTRVPPAQLLELKRRIGRELEILY